MQAAMNPDLLLSVVAALAGFVLKTTVAFGLCLALNRLVNSANLRFILWSSFVYAAAAYWLCLANSILVGRQAPASAPPAMFQPLSSTAHTWQIPASWVLPLGLAMRMAGVVYLVILSYLVFTHIRKRRHLQWVLGFTSEPPVEIAQAFQSLAKRLRVGRSRLLVLSGATSPATFGWIRPTVLLPSVCLENDRSELEDILSHELHHVRRWDSVWNGLAIACRTVLFFHPAAWYAVRKMQFDRELVCDLAVVSHSPARKGIYAECLVRFARLNMAQDPKNWGIDFAASTEHLTVRVHSILAGSKKIPGWLLCLRTVSGLTLCTLFIGVLPSLAVLLSYAHRPPSQSFTSPIQASPSETVSKARPNRKLHSTFLRTRDIGDAAGTGSGQLEAAQPTMDLPADRGGEHPSSMQSSPGVQLLHRGSTASGSHAPVNKSQSVALIDADASDQGVKTEDHDRKQALQQTATAALGLYKRASGLDRH
jgi:beta-lactamase regulating signal transducer with metallopeptidase domain